MLFGHSGPWIRRAYITRIAGLCPVGDESSGESLCLCLVYVCRTCLQDFSSLGVLTQDLVCKTQKLPLGGSVMGRGVESVTAEHSREDLLKGRWVWPGLEEPERTFQVR